MDRRDFIRLMAVLSGSAAYSCTAKKGAEKLISKLPPESDVIPGEPVFTHSVCTECPAHCGAIVRSREGLPVKLEGNPAHPINQGTLCLRGQTSLQRLYHPDRVKEPSHRAPDGSFSASTWKDAFASISGAIATAKGKGKAVVFLSGTLTGALDDLAKEYCARGGLERIAPYEVYPHAGLKESYRTAFGLDELPHYDISQADFLLSLGGDPLGTWLSPVEHSRQFANGLKKRTWIHLEGHLTLSGSKATHRLPIKVGSEPVFLAWLLKQAPHKMPLPSSIVDAVESFSTEDVSTRCGIPEESLVAILDEIGNASRPLLLLADETLPSASQESAGLLAALLQYAWGSMGHGVDFDHSYNVGTSATGQWLELAGRLEKGDIGVVVLTGIHSLDTLPTLRDALEKADYKVALTDLPLPLAQRCDWILPTSHTIESWGDSNPRKGLWAIHEPALPRPLFDTKPLGQILLDLLSQDTSWEDYVKTFHERLGLTLKEGVAITPTSHVAVEPAPEARLAVQALNFPPTPKGPFLVATPSIRHFDGRSKPLPLLHEIPEPLTVVSYGDNMVLSMDDGNAMGIEDGSIVKVATDNGDVELPVRLLPFLDKGTAAVSIANLAGFQWPHDAKGRWSPVIPAQAFESTGQKKTLAVLSGSLNAKGRGVFPHDSAFEHSVTDHRTLYPDNVHPTYRWGLSVDLDKCIGCGACVGACYVENNLPMTGEEEHIKGREISWMRIETFYDYSPNQPLFLPFMCQQCDNAPCEPVCPVYATMHSPEGLNTQVYNRCVGTRYCSNNCPYKARRFNWFEYEWPEPLDKMLNPDLSKRPSGVMEKCTFCIQRIRAGKDHAKDENRLANDGDITTACAQTCPTQAIVFGNLKSTEAKVFEKAFGETEAPRRYRVLEDIGTEPAVYYLKDRKQGGHNHDH